MLKFIDKVLKLFNYASKKPLFFSFSVSDFGTGIKESPYKTTLQPLLQQKVKMDPWWQKLKE